MVIAGNYRIVKSGTDLKAYRGHKEVTRDLSKDGLVLSMYNEIKRLQGVVAASQKYQIDREAYE